MTTYSLLAAFAAAAVVISPQTSFAEQKTVVLSVPTMNCDACPSTVRKALEKVAGVEKVKATYEPKEAVVTFDDAKIGVDKLTEATKRAGYASSVKTGK